MKIQKNKVVIIGAGNVGSAILFTLLNMSSIAEIVILDKNQQKAVGEALDAFHTTSFAYSPNVRVRAGDYSDCSDAGIIIMTAGPSVRPGEKADRISLAQINLQVMKDVMTQIKAYTNDAIIIIVSNPVDLITYYAQNYFDYPEEKIIGTGTLLDTARFRRIIGNKYFVDTKNVHGYILGEHGGTAVATWSLTNIAGIPYTEFDQNFKADTPFDKEAIVSEVKSVGFEILQSKGYTNFGVAKSVERIIKAIHINELSVLPVSTTLHGEYGIDKIAISVPCIISNEGIKQKLVVKLSDDEVDQLANSAQYLKDIFEQLEK